MQCLSLLLIHPSSHKDHLNSSNDHHVHRKRNSILHALFSRGFMTYASMFSSRYMHTNQTPCLNESSWRRNDSVITYVHENDEKISKRHFFILRKKTKWTFLIEKKDLFVASFERILDDQYVHHRYDRLLPALLAVQVHLNSNLSVDWVFEE